MSKLKVPERISQAVERLAIRSNEGVLEVGCGGGVAAALACDRLPGGRLVAIDRSETAARPALARSENRDHIADGRLQVLTTALADLTGFDAAFDILFAINVNVFWLDPRREMPVVRRILKPAGRFDLFYHPPSPGRAGEIARLAEEKLSVHGFDARPAEFDEAARSLHVAARPASR